MTDRIDADIEPRFTPQHRGRLLTALLTLGVVAAVSVTAVITHNSETGDANPAAASPKVEALRGVHYNPPRQAHDIRAIDHNSRPFVLSRQPHPLQMIFFGYVSCVDVCPTNLKKMEIIQRELADLSDQVQFVFITVAPEHERPDDMREYLAQYDGEIIGITGKHPDDLAQTYTDWGILRRKEMLDKPVLGRNYKYDHTAQIFLVQGGDRLPVSYPYGTGVDIMVEDIRALLADPGLSDRLPEVGEVREVTLAPGTYTRKAQENPTLPSYLRVRVGDSIRWRNDDYMYHFIGDISLAPGQEAVQRFDEEGTFYFGCTAVPSEVIRINVMGEDDV